MTENPPVRSFMDDPAIKWKLGHKPDYTVVNDKYMRERSKNHKADSMEKLVENLIKTWEMESVHKIEIKDFHTLVPDEFHVSYNGGFRYSFKGSRQLGGYNKMLMDSPLYDASKETADSAATLFKTALPGGFAFEVLEVLAGPPKIAFTWRHWTNFDGPYKGVAPTGERIELFGASVAVVTADMKLTDLQVFYDPNPFLAKLMGLSKDGKSKEGSRVGCPFHYV